MFDADAMFDELRQWRRTRPDGEVLWLTGAGISAESGIPTFRGEDGIWTVGSQDYHPQEMATQAAFRTMPREVWSWYLYRRGICARAKPNQAHQALAQYVNQVDATHIVTQNVDGLHEQSGVNPDRMYEIHGNIARYRCADECTTQTWRFPDAIATDWEKGRTVNEDELSLIKCKNCHGHGRPHVLWFDEYYSEELYCFQSTRERALRASVLIVVGTTGTTNLPYQMVEMAKRNNENTFIVLINKEPNDFFPAVNALGNGLACLGLASILVPTACQALTLE